MNDVSQLFHMPVMRALDFVPLYSWMTAGMECRCFLKVKNAPTGPLSPQPSTFGSPQGGRLQVMDPKKASNVEIVLKKFKMPSHCIADVRSPRPGF